MEAEGSYNRHARIPAGGATFALPLLEEAVERIELNDRKAPVVSGKKGGARFQLRTPSRGV
jgi:hypothetical protein